MSTGNKYGRIEEEHGGLIKSEKRRKTNGEEDERKVKSKREGGGRIKERGRRQSKIEDKIEQLLKQWRK